MLFWKIDEETIRCLMNKQEIGELGFDLNELSVSQEAMNEFLDVVVRSSRQYVNWNTENGIQNYIARALPADMLLITISCTYKDEAIDRDLEQIRKMTEALNARIPKERIEAVAGMTGEEKENAFLALSKDLQDVCSGNTEIPEAVSGTAKAADAAPGAEGKAAEKPAVTIPAQKIIFESFKDMTDFCAVVGRPAQMPSDLYKSGRDYVLLVDLSACESDRQASRCLMTAQEYGGRCAAAGFAPLYLEEHGRRMLKGNAVEVLSTFA